MHPRRRILLKLKARRRKVSVPPPVAMPVVEEAPEKPKKVKRVRRRKTLKSE